MKLENKIYVVDGAMGTLLVQRNLAGGCPEKLNETNFEDIVGIHFDYIEAGAEICTTNTFGANLIKLKEFGLEQECEKLNMLAVAAVRLAAKLAEKNVLIAGSVGSSGKLAKPFGEMDFAGFERCYRTQISALIEAGIDLFLLETMTSFFEAKCILKVLRSLDKNIPVAISFSFEKGRTMLGMEPKTAAILLGGLDCQIAGANCGGGAQELLDVLKVYNDFLQKPILIMPNAGIPYVEKGKTVYPMSADEFKPFVKEFVENGAQFLGGCCGTDAEFVQTIFDETVFKKSKQKIVECKRFAACERNAIEMEKIGEKLSDFDEICDYFFENDDKIIYVDVTKLENSKIEEFILELQSVVTNPMVFCGKIEQFELVDRAYNGVTVFL